MLKVSIDDKQLRRTLEKTAKDFGDTTEQAVCRLAVQFAREQATSSQAFGDSRASKLQQENAIAAGVNQVVMVLQRPKIAGGRVIGTTRNGNRISLPLSKWITSPGELNDWVEQNRTRRRGRTGRVPPDKMPAAPKKVVSDVIKQRKRKAGIAKGGWIGAGRRAASRCGESLRLRPRHHSPASRCCAVA